jgi:ATPase family associated with various cellular activities (AAA)
MVLEGPPGTAKTSFARIAAEILFGLGKIQRPDVMEVTEEDLVVGYVSQTAQRMKEVCEEALGGVCSSSRPTGSCPTEEHSFGKDAINTLLKYMEDFRDHLVVIVAGYPVEMRRFLAANPGLASRFHFTLTLENWSELGISELPTGTVPLLLADVEGWTRLSDSQPEGMADAVAHLDRTVCQIVAAHGGCGRASDTVPRRNPVL